MVFPIALESFIIVGGYRQQASLISCPPNPSIRIHWYVFKKICFRRDKFSIKRRGISVARRFVAVSESTAWKMVRAPTQGDLKKFEIWAYLPFFFILYHSRLPRDNFSSLSSRVSKYFFLFSFFIYYIYIYFLLRDQLKKKKKSTSFSVISSRNNPRRCVCVCVYNLGPRLSLVSVCDSAGSGAVTNDSILQCGRPGGFYHFLSLRGFSALDSISHIHFRTLVSIFPVPGLIMLFPAFSATKFAVI